MKRITLANFKGGVGKTTIATTVSAGLAARGHRVLLIDADAQGHATIGVHVRKYPGLYDLMVRWDDLLEQNGGDRGKAYESVTRVVPAEFYGGDGLLAVIGSNVETRNIAHSINDSWAFDDRLGPIAKYFDFCIIDTSPTPSLLHGSIFMATDYIVLPSLMEPWSLDGLKESLDLIGRAQKSKPIQIAGIVPTRYRGQTLEHSENLDKLRNMHGALLWPEVPERIVWSESASRRPIFVHAPDSDASDSAWELVDRVEDLAHG